MGDRLATIDMGRKLPPFWGEKELGSHLTQCRLSRGLPSYQVSSSSIEPFGDNRYRPKIGGTVPVWGGGPGSPSNTVWPGLRPTCMTSLILIRSTVWPQYTNITYKTGQERQTENGPIAQGEPVYKRTPKTGALPFFSLKIEL